jgi:hypothetical protein
MKQHEEALAGTDALLESKDFSMTHEDLGWRAFFRHHGWLWFKFLHGIPLQTPKLG